MVRQHRGIILAIIVTVALIAAAPASARFARALPAASTTNQSVGASGPPAANQPAHAGGSGTSHAPASSGGFRWEDAGIGAGGVLLLSALVAGMALAVTHTRGRPALGTAGR